MSEAIEADLEYAIKLYKELNGSDPPLYTMNNNVNDSSVIILDESISQSPPPARKRRKIHEVSVENQQAITVSNQALWCH